MEALTERYVVVADGRSTEALVAAGDYGYAHSCVSSENFPVRDAGSGRRREVVLLAFDREVEAHEVLAAARARGLGRPVHEDALRFGAAHPEVQRGGTIVFLHDPWLGYFERLDVLALWTNAGRREIGLQGFDARWPPGVRFAFVVPDAAGRGA
jgi:hypothetical protein